MTTAQLIITRGMEPAAFPLQVGEGIIGRAPGCTIELRHPEISRQHARVWWDGQTCTVENLSNSRGSTLNGAIITAPMPLRSGDEIGVGPVFLKLDVARAGLAATTEDPGAQSWTRPAQFAPSAQPPIPEAANVGGQIMVRGVATDRIEITGSMLIGREASCDVVLADKSVSRRHATLIAQSNGSCMVRDENSQGGSFVNGRRFDEHQFTVGDRLEIGPFCFQFDGLALVRVSNTSGGSIRATGLFMRVSERSLIGRLSGKPVRENVILDDVSVHVPPSRFFGLIGPSGAGKSSLLHTLAGLRKPEGGIVLIDGDDIYSNDAPPSFGFVPQDDIVHPELTVRQALRFSARLRLTRETPSHEIDRLIDQTMEQLILTPRANLPIHRLSGGQRKRVSVAVELLARPSILFLDEPSSGLDPATEFQLMTLLRDLADTGCTIVCTTHVMENAFLIDQLVILTGGCLAFQGSPLEVKEYFRVKKLTDLYDELGERTPREWQSEFAAHVAERPPEPPNISSIVRSPQKIRRAFALPILLARQWAVFASDWTNFLILLGQPLIIAGLVCWVTDERELIAFFAYLSTLWFGTNNAAQEIVKELAIYRRERLVGVGANPYLLSKFMFFTAATAAQAMVLYFAMNIFEGKVDGSMSLQILALLTTALAAVGIGSFISAISNSVMQAVMTVPLVLIPMIIFSGYVVKPTAMKDKKLVSFVASCTPGFMSQRLMDVSFVYDRDLIGDVNEEHYQAIKNVEANDRDNRNDQDRWVNPKPATYALLGHAAWTIVTYFGAFIVLRSRERQ
jgi:ABC transport system ATP-binding/permease protein